MIGRLVGALILLALPALAHTHGEHAEFYRSLLQPGSSVSCCDNKDCRTTDDWRETANGYDVRLAGEWVSVPPNKVLSDRPNPTGHAVICHNGRTIYCFLPIGSGA